MTNRFILIDALVLDAVARDAAGDADGAERALEHVLDVVEPDGAVIAFLLHPAPGLLERHARRRTKHASLIAEISSLLAGKQPAPSRGAEERLLEPLSESETRILR